nr:MDIS1-interacting receptor like kinase 2-like [Ipomoea batatas]
MVPYQQKEKKKGNFRWNYAPLIIFLVMPCFFPLETIASTTTEAEALLKWKSSLSVFEGFSFPLDSWSLSNLRNMCNWTGIVCNGDGAIVSEINLPNAYLSGTLHHLSFTSFPSLTRFNITGNYFNGSIPPAIGDLSNLVFLDLSYNEFDGKIPPQIGNLRRELQYLDLNGNDLSGIIPHQIGNLQKVWFLDIGHNNLLLDASHWSSKVKSFPMLRHFSFAEGTLISFTDFILYSRNLTYLDLSLTCLNGSIPESLFTNLKKLECLDLSFNDFSGPLSPNINNLSNLNDLRLSENQFQGEIPYSIGQLKDLQVLDISYNLLNSTIPPSLSSLTKLSYLDLSSNFISGNISPHLISNWTELTFLGLANNSFSSNIPSEIGSLTNLSEINLPNADLSGALDQLNFTSFPNVTRFNISGNNFRGSIPAAIAHLSNLLFLDLSNNSFNGNIPPEIGNLTVLQYLDLSRNDVSGVVPHQIGNLHKVWFLDLGSNLLLEASGLSKVKSFPVLRHLSLSGIKFMSRFPDFILRLSEPNLS